MAKANLFDSICDLDEDIFRNVWDATIPMDPFDDLIDGDEHLSDTAGETVANVTARILGPIDTSPEYNAILYPFIHESMRPSRYGDGTFAVWYGSMTPEVTVYETAFHMMTARMAVEAPHGGILVQNRAIYTVHCRALLIDLRQKRTRFPFLTDTDYTRTQDIGRRLYHEGHPGLMTPSARLANGDNLALFTSDVLSNAAMDRRLRYALDPGALTITVTSTDGNIEMLIDGTPWFPAV